MNCGSMELVGRWNTTNRATAMGNWWLATSSWQCACSCRVFCVTSNHPGYSAHLQPRFGALQFLTFPKTKITFEREEISDRWWDSGKYNGTADGDWRTVWGPKVPTLKGTEASLSYVQYFSYLVTSSINFSIFHSTWLGTFCTDCMFIKSSHCTP